MPVEIARAAVEAAHRRGKLVLAHPSNSAGARVAIEAGVDVLVHTFPSDWTASPWDRELPRMMRAREMALVPTLKLWPYELGKLGLPPAVVDAVLGKWRGPAPRLLRARRTGAVRHRRRLHDATSIRPTSSSTCSEPGSRPQSILASLTTAPAARFGAASRTGRLAPGLDADIAVLEGNPAEDVRAFASVRLAMRGGRVIYRKAP